MPIGPNTLRIFAVAVIVSAMAGIGIMWLLDAFDDSIMNIEEAKKVLDRPFLGAVPLLTPTGKKDSPGTHEKSMETAEKH
jgi:capsular polysaccharide biosynthesis protein